MNIVSLNSILLPANEAFIPIDDRGFRFGDGVFETIPVHRGRPYLLEYHLERLQTGLSALHIPYDLTILPVEINRVIAANNASDVIARLYISRGAGSQGYLPVAPPSVPTLLIQLVALPETPLEPVSLYLSSWEKISLRALPVGSKLAQGVNATLARMEARENDCYDALQQSADGFISEASSANIFWVKNGAVFTPSLSTGALAGVTRRRVMELLGNVTEGEFTLDHLQDAQGIFLTNAAMGIVAVNELKPLGLHWDSTALVAPIAALRAKDIASRF